MTRATRQSATAFQDLAVPTILHEKLAVAKSLKREEMLALGSASFEPVFRFLEVCASLFLSATRLMKDVTQPRKSRNRVELAHANVNSMDGLPCTLASFSQATCGRERLRKVSERVDLRISIINPPTNPSCCRQLSRGCV
ncbi:MAG: hypothetical protein ABFE13_15200 [Phycisphaerales bacterium]